MDIWEVMNIRHSVRGYTDKKIEGQVAQELKRCIDECNRQSGLKMQLCLEEPNAFNSMMAHYGKFQNVRNYIAVVGKKSPELDEKAGYWGEKVVLKAQELGLNSCWVALTYSKGKCAAKVEKGEKLVIVIALGYGETQGVPHKNKPLTSLCRVEGEMPGWFRQGMEAALLAPTAMNQQKFLFTLSGNIVTAKAGIAFYSKLDLGIVKCHFELGAGKDGWSWG